MKKSINIKFIIFDAYGVILKGGYPQTCEALGKKFNRDWNEIYEILYKKYFNMAATRKITQKDAWVLAIKELELPIDWKEARDIHYGFMGVNNDVAKFINTIDKNIPTLLLSKNTRSQFSDAEKLFGFKKYFTHVINTWELGIPKASKKTMRYITKKFKARPEEIIYIDDQKENLVDAKEMGVNTIFFESFAQFKNEFNNYLK